MKTYMVGEPCINWAAFWSFIQDEKIEMDPASVFNAGSAGETLPEIGGRLCYMSFGKGRKTNKEYIDNIINQKHFSVLEHANWSFIITGVSRSLTHELVRHRHFSFSQLSQRYVDESEVDFILPSPLTIDENVKAAVTDTFYMTRKIYSLAASFLEDSYKDLPATERRKAARQAARAVLPNATETKIMVTGNARAWREFIEKRNSQFADPEIRELARHILAKLHKSSPNLFADLLEAK